MLEDAKILVDYLNKSDERGVINFAEDWKLMTLLIGGNDMCAYCKDKVTIRPSFLGFTITDCSRTHRVRLLW